MNNEANSMRDAVLLDTSYLITLAEPRRERHAVATQFFITFSVAGCR